MKLHIISGILKGRSFDAPSGNRTHPMSEKIRGAIFNILGDIAGLSVLDSYAGSGAISLEAISRGASKVTAIEIDKNAFSVAKKNIAALSNPDSIKLTRANVSSWSDNNNDCVFDIVILDPPYDDVRLSLIKKLLQRHVKDNGTAVLSLPSEMYFQNPVNFEEVQHKTYGNASLIFLKRIALEKQAEIA